MSNINRFAVSSLSRKNKTFAMPEEVLVHKGIGQFLVKTADGNVISHDSLARLKNHVDDVSLIAQIFYLNGDLYSIEFNDIELPEFINEDTNILTEPLLLKTNGISKVLVSVDLDCIEINNLESILTDEPNIKVTFELRKNTGVAESRTFTVEKQVNRLNNMVNNIKELLPDITNITEYDLYLKEFIIIRNANNANKTIRNILHSVLLILE